MSKTAVVILNWNGEALLRKFLPSVIANSNHDGVEVIVADNASSDGSIDLLNEEFPETRVIRLDKNYGFAGGYNKALSLIDADYFVLLNSDVLPCEDWLSPLIKAMDEDSALGACMPKVRAYKEPEMFEYAGASGGYIDVFGYPFCRGRILNSIEKDEGQYDQPLPVFWATGAALMIRADLYKRAGGLDEKFFAHMEEIDLCWCIKNLAYQIKVFPASEVLHVGGATLSHYNAHKTFLNFRNSLLMMVKNLSSDRLLPILFVRMVLDGVAGLHFLAKGEVTHFFAVIKAHFGFYKLLPYAIKQRENNKAKVTSLHKEVYPQSIIWAFYFKKLRKFSQLKHYNLD